VNKAQQLKPHQGPNKSSGKSGALVFLSPSDLVPHPENPRKHSRSQIRSIANSIERSGYTAPIIADRHKRILAGHGRRESDKPVDASWPKLGIAREAIHTGGADIAVSVGLTHDTSKAVRAYVENLPDVGELLIATPDGGASNQSIKSGSHAFQLAETLKDGPTIATWGENVKAMGKMGLSAIKPGLSAMAEHAAFLSVRNYIICIDDLERKGEKLRIIDILGLASLLKERRKCKVVLILNDDALGDEKYKFEKFSEKVIDSSLMFEPTSAEAAAIAFKGTEKSDDLMRENCQKLNIANIRILKKIERLVNDAQPHLAKFDARVLAQAVSTLVLLGWCVYAKKDDLLSYTLNERYKSRYSMNNKLSDEQKKLDDLLEAYRSPRKGYSRRFLQDVQDAPGAYRRDLAFHNWKYAMWDAHCRLPTQTPSGRSQCFCGSEISFDNVREHVYAAHMDIEQK
jgi:hypothetical protein